MEVEVKKVLIIYLLLQVILSTENKTNILLSTTGCIKPFKVFIKELNTHHRQKQYISQEQMTKCEIFFLFV